MTMTNPIDWSDSLNAWSQKLNSIECLACGVIGSLRIELRETLVSQGYPAMFKGSQPRVVARQVLWPWMICDACGSQCRGELMEH